MHGSKRICRYPCLIAAYHVLHRLLAPRHPSCALCSLINLLPRGCLRPREIVITETLDRPAVAGRNFRLSSKKLYYYPVCRCQRTSGAWGPRSVWIPESLPSANSKRSRFLLRAFPAATRFSSRRPWWTARARVGLGLRRCGHW